MNIRKTSFVALVFVLSALTALRSQTTQAPPPATSAVPALPADIPATAERYSLLLMGNLAGQQAVWTASDGTLHMFFQFNDRGRGPKTTSIIKLDSTGIPISETIKGNDYLKSPVDENFSNDGGAAHWKNTAEQGEKKISTPAYYSPLSGAPSEIALLAHAALQNGGKIALLPEGEARVQRVLELDVEAGWAQKTRRFVLHCGLGLCADLCLAGRPRQSPRKILCLSRRMGIDRSRRMGIRDQASPRRAG